MTDDTAPEPTTDTPIRIQPADGPLPDAPAEVTEPDGDVAPTGGTDPADQPGPVTSPPSDTPSPAADPEATAPDPTEAAEVVEEGWYLGIDPDSLRVYRPVEQDHARLKDAILTGRVIEAADADGNTVGINTVAAPYIAIIAAAQVRPSA